jgi:hypothetical protein
MIRFLAEKYLNHLAPEDSVNRGSVSSNGVGVPNALRPLCIPQANGIELERENLAMCAVCQHFRKWDTKEAGLDA